jgi:dTDP-L-rhamnose 4-epimerase
MSEKVLITGGAGFIGSFAVDRFIAAGADVRVLDSLDPQVHPEGVPAYFNRRAELIRADVRDRAAVAEALRDVDIVLHCAAAVGVGQSLYQVERYVDVNSRGTATLLDVLIERKQRLKKLIVLTSMTQYGEGVYRRPSDGALLRIQPRTEEDVRAYGWEPVCPDTGEVLESVATPESSALLADNTYALTKRHQEELALTVGARYGIPTVCFRMFNVYGPRQSLSNPYTGVLAIFLSRMAAGQAPVVYEDGRQTRDFISVHDIASAVMHATRTSAGDGEIFNLGSGVPRPIQGCAETLAELTGRDPSAAAPSGQFRRGDIRHCYADMHKTRTRLGFEPAVTWEDGLAELIDWSAGVQASDNFDLAERELRAHGLVV